MLTEFKMQGGRFLVQAEGGTGTFATFAEAAASPQAQALPSSLQAIFVSL